jgi:hypothetical protein
MAYWCAPVEGYPPEHRDFARVRQKAEKIVFSRTLTAGTTGNTRVERNLDVDAVRRLKRESEHDIFIGGPSLRAWRSTPISSTNVTSFSTR